MEAFGSKHLLHESYYVRTIFQLVLILAITFLEKCEYKIGFHRALGTAWKWQKKWESSSKLVAPNNYGNLLKAQWWTATAA